jgi:aspartyl-tRNA synthetase
MNVKIGELGLQHVGKTVILSGWALKPRKIGGSLSFLPLRDSTGLVQLVHDMDTKPTILPLSPSAQSNCTTTSGNHYTKPSGPNIIQEKNDHDTILKNTTSDLGLRLLHLSKEFNAHDVRLRLLSLEPESVVSVVGQVRQRPSSSIKSNQATGDIEVLISNIHVDNPSAIIPFSLQSNVNVPSEDTLLKYRHVHMRQPFLQRNLRLRSRISQVIRNHLHNEGFTEVETPYLFKSTPEGAREFLVPTRKAGFFYALPQSPQQFKQTLMAGGIEKYFQFARCFRDESLGSDR